MKGTARAIGIVLVTLLVGCKKHEDRLEANRQAMLASVTPCPAPATCSAKIEAAVRTVSICSPAIDAQAYAVGDTVVVKELGAHNTLGRIKGHRGNVYDVEFADGFTLERAADHFMGRLCR